MEFRIHLGKYHQLAPTLHSKKKYSRTMSVRNSKISKGLK
jgi:hypothetical protein